MKLPAAPIRTIARTAIALGVGHLTAVIATALEVWAGGNPRAAALLSLVTALGVVASVTVANLLKFLTDAAREDPRRAFETGSDLDRLDDEISGDAALLASAVYASVTLIADAVAAMPLQVYEEDAHRTRRVDPPEWADPDTTPNPWEDAYTFKFRSVMGVAFAGNAYHRIITRDDMAYPQQIMNLHPDWTWPYREHGEELFQVTTAEETQPGSATHPLTRYTARRQDGQVLHTKYWDTGLPLGACPLTASSASIQSALTVDEYSRYLFGSGGVGPAVIEMPADAKDIGGEAIKEMGKAFRKNLHRPQHRAIPVVIKGGGEWKPIGFRPNQAQLINERRMSVHDIARLYRVPVHMLAEMDLSTWGAGIREMNKHFHRTTLLPYAQRLETSYRALLRPGQYARFDPTEFLRGDTKDRYDAYAVAIAAGFLTPNEVRTREDLPPIEGGDKIRPTASPANGGDQRDLVRLIGETIRREMSRLNAA